jgi:hypothetical protein
MALSWQICATQTHTRLFSLSVPETKDTKNDLIQLTIVQCWVSLKTCQLSALLIEIYIFTVKAKVFSSFSVWSTFCSSIGLSLTHFCIEDSGVVGLQNSWLYVTLCVERKGRLLLAGKTVFPGGLHNFACNNCLKILQETLLNSVTSCLPLWSDEVTIVSHRWVSQMWCYFSTVSKPFQYCARSTDRRHSEVNLGVK